MSNDQSDGFVIIGVWADGVPVDIDHYDTYEEALWAFEHAYAPRRGKGGAPFYGILDESDPERGYGPWEEIEDESENPAYGPGNPDWEHDLQREREER